VTSPRLVPLDQLIQLRRQDGVDTFGFHALQVRPELVHVLLAEVAEEQGAVGGLRPREVGVEHGAAEAAAIALTGGHRSSSPHDLCWFTTSCRSTLLSCGSGALPGACECGLGTQGLKAFTAPTEKRRRLMPFRNLHVHLLFG